MMTPVVATVAAVASSAHHEARSSYANNRGYGATVGRRVDLPNEIYQSFRSLPDEAPYSPTPEPPRATLAISLGARQVAPSLLCLGASALCLTLAGYTLGIANAEGERPAVAAVAPLIALSTGLNLAALYSARRIGAPPAEPENIVD